MVCRSTTATATAGPRQRTEAESVSEWVPIGNPIQIRPRPSQRYSIHCERFKRTTVTVSGTEAADAAHWKFKQPPERIGVSLNRIKVCHTPCGIGYRVCACVLISLPVLFVRTVKRLHKRNGRLYGHEL